MSTPRSQLTHLKHDPNKREELRRKVSRSLDLPMALASALLVLLTFVQLNHKLSAGWQGTLATIQVILWASFAFEFALKFLLAPHKWIYIKRHWADLLVVLMPFLGFLRLFRGIVLLSRFVVSGSRSMRPQLVILRKRKLGRLALLSVLVVLVAATLEFIFEDGAPGSTINTFGDALWWAAAIATTVGNQLYPVTLGGKIVAFLLMLYAIGVFSYVTSSIASALIGGDAQEGAGSSDQQSQQNAPSPNGDMTLSPDEVAALRAILSKIDRIQSAQ